MVQPRAKKQKNTSSHLELRHSTDSPAQQELSGPWACQNEAVYRTTVLFGAVESGSCPFYCIVLNINIMERKTSQENNYHTNVRLVDDRPVLILTRPPLRLALQFKQHTQLHADLYNQPILNDLSDPPLNQMPFETASPHCKSWSGQFSCGDGSGSADRRQQTKYGQLKKTKDSDETHRSKCSLTAEPRPMVLGSETLTVRSEYIKSLESLQCMQSASVHEGDSYDFDEAESEIMQLSNEEREFFQNFIEPGSQQNRQIQELFKQLTLKSDRPLSQKAAEGSSLPENKLHLTRNFFRPREGAVKNQKTSAAIQSLQEQIICQLKEVHELHFSNQEQHKTNQDTCN